VDRGCVWGTEALEKPLLEDEIEERDLRDHAVLVWQFQRVERDGRPTDSGRSANTEGQG
jgi:hypothetical protein